MMPKTKKVEAMLQESGQPRFTGKKTLPAKRRSSINYSIIELVIVE